MTDIEQPGSKASQAETQFKTDYRAFGAPPERLDLDKVRHQLESLVATSETPLTATHLEKLLTDIADQKLKLRCEDLDILKRADGQATPLIGLDGQILTVDRNIAHLYFRPDGTYSIENDRSNPGTQLLHGVSDVMVITPTKHLLCQQWLHSEAKWRNIGIIGGHIPAGTDPAQAGLKEIPEELGWLAKHPDYIPQGRFEPVGKTGQFPAPNPGDAEAKSVFRYHATATEWAWIQDYKKWLDDQRDKLGKEGFLAKCAELQETKTGMGEQWAIHFIDPKELLSPQRLDELNAGVDIRGYLKEPVFKEALFEAC